MNLSDRIEQDLAARLAADQPLPFRLTLSDLARHYGVSAMPVRQAVERLVDAGHLLRQDNGRLEAAAGRPSVPSVAAPQLAGTDLTDDIDQRITGDVVLRCLTSDTHYLREAAVAERFGVGRTVVRRVLGRLAGQGVIEHVPRCGWRVRPLGEKDMLDYLEIREMLELKAMELAMPRLDREVLRDCLDGNRPGGKDRPTKLDNRLHREWIAKSENRYIADFFEHNGAFYAAIFDHAALEPGATARMARQHRDILNALLADDLPRAQAALTTHIRSQQPNVARLMSHLNGKA